MKNADAKNYNTDILKPSRSHINIMIL